MSHILPTNDLDEEIVAHQKEVDYKVREYPIEVVVDKHVTGQENGLNEIFVPDYQRDLVWDNKRQSRFIESLLIGLPIPYIFVADVGNEDPELSGRLEIIDGTQRIRTLARFFRGDLVLSDLEKLKLLNGRTFSDLLRSRQRRFGRITIRLIELTEQASEETRRDMFERINTGFVSLNPMERRRGVDAGKFVELVEQLSTSETFAALAPVSESNARRFERQELISRFFAFRDGYMDFDRNGSGKSVASFVDVYVKTMNERILAEASLENELTSIWDQMLIFVSEYFPSGFAKSTSAKSTPRVRFEAISVGSSLALTAHPELATQTRNVAWLDSDEFKTLTTSDAANNRSKLIQRIEFVRDQLLNNNR